MFADFQPIGAANLTLGTDVTFAGDVVAVGLPAPDDVATVDGYTVTMDGAPAVGDTELSFTVEFDGQVVRTEPYLGAAGHLVAIRSGDLAYLHVHPHESDAHVGRYVHRRVPDRRAPTGCSSTSRTTARFAPPPSRSTSATTPPDARRSRWSHTRKGTDMSTDTTQSAAGSQIQLDIGGMTCASCAARIEKKLNRMDGVTATVNYATEKAKVTFADTVTPADLIAQVEATGYTARLPATSRRPATPATVQMRRVDRRSDATAAATPDHLRRCSPSR